MLRYNQIASNLSTKERDRKRSTRCPAAEDIRYSTDRFPARGAGRHPGLQQKNLASPVKSSESTIRSLKSFTFSATRVPPVAAQPPESAEECVDRRYVCRQGQVILLGLDVRPVADPENLTLIECGWPFFRLAGVLKMKTWNPLPFP